MKNVIYSNARAKSLEKNLLTKERLVKMIEATSTESAFKILTEAGFGEGAHLDLNTSFEKPMLAEESKLKAFIKEACPVEEVKKFFLIESDFHNAEAYLKVKHLGISEEGLTVSDGIYNKLQIKEKILSDEYGVFFEELKNAIVSAEKLFISGTATGKKISHIFKKALFLTKKKLSCKNSILREIYSFEADATNVSIALRERNFKALNESSVEGGVISETELKILSTESPENLLLAIKNSKRKDLLDVAVKDFVDKKPLLGLENLSNSFAVRLLKKDKYNSEGLRPFLLYCFSKKNDIYNARLIIALKSADVEPAEIKSRLRDCYE